MSINQFDKLTQQINIRKNELIYEIEKELSLLKENNISVDIDITQLRRSNNVNSLNKKEYLQLREKLAELDFLERVKPHIAKLPTSNGTSYYEKMNVNIGIIADEFLYNSFKDVANFYYVEKDNYKALDGKIDVLLIASAWKGLNNDWKGMGNPKISKMRKTIFEMIDFYKKQGVKIVFYSKEDPTNYEYFVDIAKKCEYIFTTAAEKVEDYKKDCNNENVFVLEFGVNPVYNNPIGIEANTELSGAMFAGSWYVKYPVRQKETMILFDGIINAGNDLKILDRNYVLNLEQHFYPTIYFRNISPGVDHESLQSLTKLYEWVVNLNTVKYSQTMFANRVYELQAMGNLLLSNYSLGINNYFPNIFFAFDQEEIKYIMNSYSDKEKYQHRLFGVRQVLRKHTTFHRVNYLLESIGLGTALNDKKIVAVVVKEKTYEIQKMFDYQSYEYKMLLTEKELLDNEYKMDFITFFNESYFYGEYYLEDMINVFKYTDASYVTKDSYYDGKEKIDGTENNYIERIKNKDCTIFSLDKFKIEEIIYDFNNISQTNGYSSDSLEFNITTEPAYETSKTKKFTVIVPTYNNGQHLYGKCFMSLRRSSMFDEMEIIIVDDGSTDKETLMIIDRLDRQYSNVKLFKFNDGGSGSASRPRNKGIELSTTDYITYLDPDNEAVNDGYANLYEVLIDEDYDLVVGNMKKCDIKEYDFNYYKDIVHYEAKTEFHNYDVSEFLGNTYFKAQSIQALMVKKEIIVKNNLKMVEKAVGEDTLFFHQLIANANNFKVINNVIHIYYAGVQGSAVNSISKKTFDKYLILEKERFNYLKQHNMLDIYIEKRFNYYFKNWYMKKLEMVVPNDYNEAIKVLYEIYELYEKEISRREIDQDIKIFIKRIKKNIEV